MTKINARNQKEKVIYGLIYLSAALTIGALVWILAYIISRGIGHVNFDFITKMPRGDKGGIFPMIINTLYLIFVSIGIATPIGIMSAIYLVEYAKPGKVVNIIRFATESLAGIPSIIYGLFGMMFFVTTLDMGWSIIAGALTVSIMLLPTIIRTTEEALIAVPGAWREASLGLGASKLRTVWRIIIPSALPGILVAIILSVGRVIGESAAIYLTAGMVPRLAKSVFDSGRTLTVHMFLLAKEGISFDLAYATATVLIVVILVINLLAKFVVSKVTQKLES